MQVVKCKDGKEFKADEFKLVGSVKTVRNRDVTKPGVVGEYPVLVEQSGSFKMFTYSRRIESITP